MKKPNPDDKWSWGTGDLKWYHPPGGKPLFSTEELERVLKENARIEEELKKKDQQRP